MCAASQTRQCRRERSCAQLRKRAHALTPAIAYALTRSRTSRSRTLQTRALAPRTHPSDLLYVSPGTEAQGCRDGHVRGRGLRDGHVGRSLGRRVGVRLAGARNTALAETGALPSSACGSTALDSKEPSVAEDKFEMERFR